MPLRAAAAVRALLVASALSWAGGAPLPCVASEPSTTMTPDPAQRPPDPATPTGDARRADRSATVHDRDPDPDLLDHLDVIEDLELLQNLDLFDTGATRGK